jgi:putative peptidoglycan lipid II flippase
VRGLFLSLGLGLALFQLNVFLDGLIAYTSVEEGGVSTLYFANRLVQLPIGVFGVALATAVFPALTRLAKRGETEELGRVLERGVRLGAFVSIPAAVGRVTLADPIVSTLFERGRFDAASSARTGFTLLLLAPAVITACVTSVITRAFYAEEQVKTPVRVGAACVLLNLILNLLLVGPLQEAGLALATSISQGINLIAQAWLYRRRRLAKGDTTRSSETARTVLTCVVLAALMGAAAWSAHRVCPGPEALRLAVGVATGAFVYGGLALALRMREPQLLLSRG